MQGPIGGYLAFSGALTVSTGRGGAPAYRAVRLGPRPLVHGGVEGMGGSFCLGKADYATLCGEVRKSAIDYAILTFGTK